MAALQCEICGGKLIGKPGGLFECESCGMEYNTDWAKAKIQEIKGTVKVEGTVEVKGTVKVDTTGKAETLLQYVKEEIRHTPRFPGHQRSILEWKKTTERIEKTLDDILLESPKEYWVYLFRSLKTAWIEDEYQTLARLTEEQVEKLEKDPNWHRALEYAPAEIGEELRQTFQNRKVHWKSCGDEFDTVLSANQSEIDTLEARVRELNERIYWEKDVLVAHTADGEALISFAGKPPVTPVKNVIQILVNNWYVSCLHGNGTVTVVCRDALFDKVCRETSTWRNIIRLCKSGRYLFGIAESGSLCVAGAKEGENLCAYAISWQDVIGICSVESKYGKNRYLLGITVSGEIKETIPGICRENCNARDIESAEDKLKKQASNPPRQSMYLCSDTERKKIWQKNGMLAVADADLGNYVLTTEGSVWLGKQNQPLQGEYSRDIPVVFVANWMKTVLMIYEDGMMEIQNTDGKPVHFQMQDWKLFENVNTADQEWHRFLERIAEEKAERERQRQERREKLLKEKDPLLTELSNLRGIFTGKRRKELEGRIAEIEKELKELS